MDISERIWGSLPKAGNATSPSVAPPAMENPVWEPPTVVVVGIFCCVCVLHLSAFVYAICFRIQQPIPASSQKRSAENEAITFHSSSLGTHECSGGSNIKEGKGSAKSGSCWSSF